jgi:peptidoglycan hydrolase CwlO-like protein
MNLKKSFLCLFIFLSIFACTPKIFAVITRAQRAAAEVQRATRELRDKAEDLQEKLLRARKKSDDLQTQLKKALADDEADERKIRELKEKLEEARRVRPPEVAAPEVAAPPKEVLEEIKMLRETNKKLSDTNKKLRDLLKDATKTIGKEIQNQDEVLLKINKVIEEHEYLERENERLRTELLKKVEPKKKRGFWKRLFRRK